MIQRITIMVLSLVLGAWNASTIAQREHPKEHPTAKKEHPKGAKQAKGTVLDPAAQSQYEKMVKDYIASEASKNGGVYTVHDDVTNKDLKLELVRVHKNKICMLQEGKTCFACADFKEVNGNNRYDLDFYAKKDDGSFNMDKVLIHKVNGKPRFTYDKNNNIVAAKK